MLIDHFKKSFDSVCSANVIYDSVTKQPKGYGFVQFTNKNDAEMAIAELNGSFLNGKAIKVKERTQKSANRNRGMNHHGGTDIEINSQGITIWVSDRVYLPCPSTTILGSSSSPICRATLQTLSCWPPILFRSNK